MWDTSPTPDTWPAPAQTGEICLDILKGAWSPAWTLQSTCQVRRLHCAECKARSTRRQCMGRSMRRVCHMRRTHLF
jgi:hypothetical protein